MTRSVENFKHEGGSCGSVWADTVSLSCGFCADGFKCNQKGSGGFMCGKCIKKKGGPRRNIKEKGGLNK